MSKRLRPARPFDRAQGRPEPAEGRGAKSPSARRGPQRGTRVGVPVRGWGPASPEKSRHAVRTASDGRAADLRPSKTPNAERLQKILSAAGIASRRHSEQLILDGRVTVNGATVTELGTKADPEHDDIRVDGRRIRTAQRLRYILLNKPRGYVTTRSDPQHRATVMDLLEDVREYVYPVGRLDYESEGLLLLTNDGDLAARLTHPRHEVDRVYEARVRGIPDAHEIERLERGILIDGRRTAPARVKLAHRPSPPFPRHSGERPEQGRRASGPQAVLLLTIHEGRHRQVRKMLEAIGHPVVRLRRVRIGPISDETLKTGHYRDLTRAEITALQRTAAAASAGGASDVDRSSRRRSLSRVRGA